MSSKTQLLIQCIAIGSIATLSASELTYAPLKVGYTHQFSSDIDGGGSVSNGTLKLSAGVPLIMKDDLTLALTAGFEQDSYDFSTGKAGSFASLNPWNDIQTIKLGSYLRWDIQDKWTLIATPSVRSVSENGASLSDSLQAGSNVGLQYKISDSLTIGSGFGFQSQIEDSASIFPLILLDWKINDELSLTTAPGAGASAGPGISLRWDSSDTMRFSLGFSYDRSRFRLNKDNPQAPAGVGEDSGIPVYASMTWKSSEHTQTSIIAGVKLASSLELADKSGNRIIKRDYDPTPFLGINLGYTF